LRPTSSAWVTQWDSGQEHPSRAEGARILRQQPKLRASLVDPSESVGLSLTGSRRDSVRLYPSTAVRDCAARGVPMPDVVVVADVLHHLTPSGRKGLFLEIRDFTRGHSPVLVVKDVAPQG